MLIDPEKKLWFEDGPLPLDFPRLERITELSPAYDRRSPDPDRNFGIHGIDLWMWLKGPEGAVQFHLMTNWWPLNLQREKEREPRKFSLGTTRRMRSVIVRGSQEEVLGILKKHDTEHSGPGEEITECVDTSAHSYPVPADLGYHSRKPRYEGHRPMGSMKTFWREPTEEERLLLPGIGQVPETYEVDGYAECRLVDSEPCYYDGSGSNASRIYAILLEGGSDAVWQALGQYYYATFRAE